MKKKVYLMLSGGVDSSVAGAILNENPDYKVIGVFMKCWSLEKLREKGFSDSIYACNWEEDEVDARMAAMTLGIDFEVWDFQNEYADYVIDYMIDEYSLGRTPNPDVMCNSVVKFGAFYNHAISLGAAYVATGHYAKIININEDYYIGHSKDLAKDQSYFLWKIPKVCLSQTLFPIGEINSKSEVRNIAAKYNLLTSTKKDSQGLCFVGKSNLSDMLTERLGVNNGIVYTKDIERAKNACILTKSKLREYNLTGLMPIGSHQGAYHFTIGQRNNLGVSGGPWFVSKVNIQQNSIEVVHKDNSLELQLNRFIVTGVNLFNLIDKSTIYTCQVRYNQKLIKCTVSLILNTASGSSQYAIELQESTIIAPGQSFVMYNEDILVMGGIISYI